MQAHLKVSKGSLWGGRAFFFVFFLFGAGFFYGIVIRPLSGVVRSLRWDETPCVIKSSRVREHSGSDGSTYSVDITYRYVHEGVEHESSRYNFSFGSSSGSKKKQAIVDRYPPGSRSTCWVNPSDPSQAVLSRAVPRDIWFGLIPTVFLAVGVGGMFFAGGDGKRGRLAPRDALGRLVKQDGKAGAEGDAYAAAARRSASGFTTLTVRDRPFKKLLLIILAALFWNGIISIFVYQAWETWRSGKPELVLILFLIPFVLIGLLIVAGVFYNFLALFNPTVVIELEEEHLKLGGEARLRWRVEGNTARLTSLRIELIGREEAQYRRGTNTHTDRSIFEYLVLSEATERRAIAQGESLVLIPRETMHTFEAANNKIEWMLHVHGPIARWPDVKAEFPILVLPGAAPAAPVYPTDEDEGSYEA